MVNGPIFTKNQYLNPLELHSACIKNLGRVYPYKEVDDEH